MKYVALAAVAIAAFAGTATAGVGNGTKPNPGQAAVNSQSSANNGNGNGSQAAPQASAKPDSQSQPAPKGKATGNKNGSGTASPAPTAAPATPPATPPGQAKQAAKANGPGVKPSNTTGKWTTCTVGGSPSAACTGNGPKTDGSKQYGNGRTAAQVALGKGAPAGAVLTGPGNSQPHKITGCGMPDNPSGGVDVHAYHPGTCTTPSAPAAAAPVIHASIARPAKVKPAPTKVRTETVSPPAAWAPPDVASAASSPSSPVTAATVLPTGGVLGVKVTVTKKQAKADTPHVLPARVASFVVRQTLPFTGLRIWTVMLAGLALIAAGMALRFRRGAAFR